MNLWNAFAYPWLLPLALILIPLIWWAWLSKKRSVAVRFSVISRLQHSNTSWSMKARHLLPLLRSLAVLLLVISIARPRKADELTRIQTEGVAIQLVVDRSGSMAQEDFIGQRGRKQSRLQAVKQVVKGFIEGDGDELEGRPDDLIGLTVFARYPDTECPLTQDHDHLIRALDRIRVPKTRDEDGTAIGDALLLAVQRIRNIARRFSKDDDFKIKSRAIILLTDGEQNAGKYKPIKAAEAAQAMDIKVYTIGAAPEFQEQRGLFAAFGPRRVPIDEESLKKVARMTGGRYFRAKDTDSLEGIYAEIDKLERSTVDEERYYSYEELAYVWITWNDLRLPPPLLVVLLLLAMEVVLANTRFRKIP
ncbi:MAG: VWA domain-containing protein [Phycisphaerales bacterium]|nr:VWA domain-containing protein [Phycisphaerales bacterium]